MHFEEAQILREGGQGESHRQDPVVAQDEEAADTVQEDDYGAQEDTSHSEDVEVLSQLEED
jgi:hypothetical protein